jgi:hypothetical protein
VATGGRDLSTDNGTTAAAAVDLYWLPVGAGDGPWFPLSCRVYEALVARIERRPTCDLYHSALKVHLPEGTFVIEQAPDRTSMARSGASSPKASSAVAGRAGFGPSATKSVAGTAESFRISPTPWTAPGL